MRTTVSLFDMISFWFILSFQWWCGERLAVLIKFVRAKRPGPDHHWKCNKVVSRAYINLSMAIFEFFTLPFFNGLITYPVKNQPHCLDQPNKIDNIQSPIDTTTMHLYCHQILVASENKGMGQRWRWATENEGGFSRCEKYVEGPAFRENDFGLSLFSTYDCNPRERRRIRCS